MAPKDPALAASEGRFTWADIEAYARTQGVGQNPRRSPDGEAIYALYKGWLLEQGLDNHGYVMRFAK